MITTKAEAQAGEPATRAARDLDRLLIVANPIMENKQVTNLQCQKKRPLTGHQAATVQRKIINLKQVNVIVKAIRFAADSFVM